MLILLSEKSRYVTSLINGHYKCMSFCFKKRPNVSQQRLSYYSFTLLRTVSILKRIHSREQYRWLDWVRSRNKNLRENTEYDRIYGKIHLNRFVEVSLQVDRTRTSILRREVCMTAYDNVENYTLQEELSKIAINNRLLRGSSGLTIVPIIRWSGLRLLSALPSVVPTRQSNHSHMKFIFPLTVEQSVDVYWYYF